MKTSYLFLLAFLANTFLMAPPNPESSSSSLGSSYSSNSSDNDNSGQCGICLNSMCEDRAMLFECGNIKHEFHWSCATDWITSKSISSANCPLCRKPLKNFGSFLNETNKLAKSHDKLDEDYHKLEKDISKLEEKNDKRKDRYSKLEKKYKQLQEKHSNCAQGSSASASRPSPETQPNRSAQPGRRPRR